MPSLRANGVEWATKNDWINHRPLICKLYKYMTCQQVSDYMQRKHAFRATLKMYKDRFAEWGEGKHHKDSEMRVLVKEANRRVELTDETLLSIGNKTIPYKEVQRYWRRRGLTILDVLNQNNSTDGTSSLESLSPNPTTPREFAITEQLVYCIDSYVTGSFESGEWTTNEIGLCCNYRLAHNGRSAQHYNALFNQTMLACDLFDQKDEEAGKTIVSAQASIVEIVRSGDLTTFVDIISLVLDIGDRGRPEIARYMLTQFTKLAHRIWGDAHPVTQYFVQLQSVDLLQYEDVLPLAMSRFCEKYEESLGEYHRESIQMRQREIKEVYGPQNLRRQELALEKLLKKCRLAVPHRDLRILQVKLDLAWAYFRNDKPQEATVEAREVVTDSSSLPHSGDHLGASGSYLLAWVSYDNGDTHSAIAQLNTAIKTGTARNGPQNSVAPLWLKYLETWLIEDGRPIEATVARDQRQRILEPLIT